MRRPPLPNDLLLLLSVCLLCGLLRLTGDGRSYGLVIVQRPLHAAKTPSQPAHRWQFSEEVPLSPAPSPLLPPPPPPPPAEGRPSRAQSAASRPAQSMARKVTSAVPKASERRSPLMSGGAHESQPDADAHVIDRGLSDTELVASESTFRRCCARAWRERWTDHATEYCEKADAQSTTSSLRCVETTPHVAPDGDGDGDSANVQSRGSSPAVTTWYCEARRIFINASAISLGTQDLTVPTAAQKNLWRRRALLFECRLRWDALRQPRRFGMLLRQLLPGAVGELGAAARQDARFDLGESSGSEGSGLGGLHTRNGRGGHGHEGNATVVVFVARYSVKNFFLAHFDLLQVAAVLLHALGPELGGSSQLVFLPPDKANHGWWGPHRPLWAALSTRSPISYAEWLAAAQRKVERQTMGLGAHEVSAHGASASTPPALVLVERAVIAISGLHSVYGRGLVGRSIETSCSSCATAAGGTRRLARVSAFYRSYISVALARAGLLYMPPLSSTAGTHTHADEARRTANWTQLHGVWISRGKGLGNGYGSVVGRRCLNEEAVLSAVRSSHLPIGITALELADLPLLAQLPYFRDAALITGMHGAGYANMIFMAPGSVVAELCPLGYCTPSYERLAARLDLTYMRWTNTIAENAKAGYDTIVDIGQFLAFMKRALKTLPA